MWICHCASVASTRGAVQCGGSLDGSKALWDRIKTDRRDALKLARLLRAGELKAIYIPEPTDEAIRDLCRARTDAVDDLRRSRHRLKALLLRDGYRYLGKSAWRQAHMRYLRELVLPDPAVKVILEDVSNGRISAAQERIQRCETAMIDRLSCWRLRPAVEALTAFKGFQLLAAMITVSELGTSSASIIPAKLRLILGWFPVNRPAATNVAREQSPKRATPTRGGSSLNGPNITRRRPRSVKNSRTAKAATL